jgi:hypothetical protein
MRTRVRAWSEIENDAAKRCLDMAVNFEKVKDELNLNKHMTMKGPLMKKLLQEHPLQTLFDSVKDDYYKVFRMGHFCTVGDEKAWHITFFKHGVSKKLCVSDGKRNGEWFDVDGINEMVGAFNKAFAEFMRVK